MAGGGLRLGFFNKTKGQSKSEADEVVYLFTLKIVSGETLIPPPMRGAYVVAYSLGATPEAALEKSWRKLQSMGYAVEDANPTGGSVVISDWDVHVAERWPEFADHFPNRRSLISELAERGAIFSPFAGFE